MTDKPCFVDGSHLRDAARAGRASRSGVRGARVKEGLKKLTGTRSGRASLGALVAVREYRCVAGARSARGFGAVSTVAVASISEQGCWLAGTALRAEPGLRAGAGTGFARAGGLGSLRLPAVPKAGARVGKAKASATLWPNTLLNRTRNGVPRLGLISFWPKRVTPLRAG